MRWKRIQSQLDQDKKIEEIRLYSNYTPQEEKLSLITATQPVDLDAMETKLDTLTAVVVLKGLWDASTGVFPGGGATVAGWSYIVSVGGTVDGVTFNVNDRVLAIVDNASTSTFAGNWFKLDYTDQVLSVAGKTGAVTIQVADITDMSANGRSLASAADYSAMRGLLDLEVGTDVQAYDADLASWAGVTRASGFDTFVATPSSANLASLVTGETGSGALMFGTSPSVTTDIRPVSHDGASLGTAALGFSDLWLATGGVVTWGAASTPDLTLTHSSNLLTGAGGSFAFGDGAIATNASDGFLYVPTCAGTPTGTPTAVTGYAPIVVDTTNNKLYFYSGGAWRDAGP